MHHHHSEASLSRYADTEVSRLEGSTITSVGQPAASSVLAFPSTGKSRSPPRSSEGRLRTRLGRLDKPVHRLIQTMSAQRVAYTFVFLTMFVPILSLFYGCLFIFLSSSMTVLVLCGRLCLR